MEKFSKILKSKKVLIVAICALVLLAIGCLMVDTSKIKVPNLYLSSEFSKTVQTVQGGYSWSNWHENVIADSIHPTEFQYTDDNTMTVERGAQLILGNKKLRIDRRYPFELASSECFDGSKKTVEEYQVSPTYINNDLYLNAPVKNGTYICSVILKYKQGTVGYGYKLVVADGVAKLNALYANKTAYVGNNSRVSAIAHNLTVPNQLGWGGMELKTEDEPYGLTINYLISDEDLGKINLDELQNTFQKNAIAMFSLIGNVENITINLKQGGKTTVFDYSRKQADEFMGQDVHNFAQTEESFRNFLSQLY